MRRTALLLAGFALIGAGLITVTVFYTKDIIADNERIAFLAHLSALVPEDRYDNQLTEDCIEVRAPAYFGTADPVLIYRAYRRGEPVALFATIVAPDGYSGTIKLLIGVYADGVVAGVRVLAHRETPGLGDAIDSTRSDWILGFNNTSLAQVGLNNWRVKKDGGYFDQLTGATITARAVVRAIGKFLEYFDLHREQLFR